MLETYFDMTDEELQAITENSGDYTTEAVDLAQKILAKREVFSNFSIYQLRKYLNHDTYDETDKKIMKQIISQRTHKVEASSVSFRNFEAKDAETEEHYTRALLEQQTRDIHTIKNCAIFFVVLTILSMIAGFAWMCELMEMVLKIY